MKFLDDIKALQDAKAALEQTIRDGAAAHARQVAELRAIIDNAPKPFSLDISHNGQDFTVSEKDGLVLLAALTRALDHEEVAVRLASGQTPKLRITDLEHVAKLVLEAAAA